ncbi:MAG: family 16 glycosylhydrolase [Gammaproteobacteria bacterium]
MQKSLVTIAILAITSTTYAGQEAGVGVESTVATGYGLYAVTMRASSAPGTISSFYLYEQNGTFPSRWREIDLELTPGFTGIGTVADPNHPHTLAQGSCYSSTASDNLPDKANCSLQPFLTGSAGSALSFNTYNYRSIDGAPYAHSNDQVFMSSNSGNNVFSNYYTYYFYYTPKGIYWTKDLPAQNLTVAAPTQLPQPSFVKKDFNTVANNAMWNPAQNSDYQGFVYDSLPLTPKKSDGSLAESGALMKISMNLWDGSNTDAAHKQDWGGEKSPAVGSSSSYEYVAYYPLTTPVNEVVDDPTKLTYGAASVYSDFTTTDGKFLVNQKETTFNALWQVSNGSYLWPLGQLDERNLYCGKGELTMKISDPYSAPRNNYDALKNCDWLNLN